VIDGNQKQVFVGDRKVSSIPFRLPFFNNFGDNYTVIVPLDGYQQAGFTPIKVSPAVSSKADLMLIPIHARFDFSAVTWDWIKSNLPFAARGVNDAVGSARL
jgi:hypothetical protein